MVERPGKIQPEAIVEPAKLKIVVVGEPSVGKTSICKRFTQGEFSETEEKTVGSDFYSKSLTKPGSKT